MQRCTDRKLARRAGRKHVRNDSIHLHGDSWVQVERVRILAGGVRAWRSYRGAAVATRVFLAARLLVLPLKPLAKEFERLQGHVLGVGSGHGLVARFLA